MAEMDVTHWLRDNARTGVSWYAKRLSANDTLANNTHQAGPYIPKDFLFRVLPALNRPSTLNPDATCELQIDSHGDRRSVRAIWYNNALHPHTRANPTTAGRNETRVTNFGGRASPLLDPESTGALVVFCFWRGSVDNTPLCRVWVCRSAVEEAVVEDWLGDVEPGFFRYWGVDQNELPDRVVPAPKSCALSQTELPPAWLNAFPTGDEIVQAVLARRPAKRGQSSDERLISRRDCEFELFKSVEQAIELPAILRGFETLDGFLSRAQTILQRRKARAGRSLELHTRQLFLEAGLVEGTHFQSQPESERGKRPDFLFPSQAAYKDPTFPDDKLRLLAVKTTCRDRWRQVINEADRVKVKHLLTLQEGVSEAQFREMQDANVRLVVPARLQKSYPASVRGSLTSVEEFLATCAA